MNRNKKYIILLFCLLISSCTFFTQYGRDYKRAHNQYIESDYDKAIQYCIKSLKRKPDFKKSLKMYEELVPLAIESHHYNIEKYSNSPNSPDKLVEQFEKLFSLIRTLKKARISKSYELYIKSDYSKEYNIALENAATSIRVFFAAAKKSTSDIKVLFKTLGSDESKDFDEKGYTFFNTTGITDQTVRN